MQRLCRLLSSVGAAVLAEAKLTPGQVVRINARLSAHNRAARWVAVALVLAMVCAGTAAADGDAWTGEDTAYQALWSALHVIDWGQTRAIANDPDRYDEDNPIIGEHPDRGRVDAYMAASLVVNALVAKWLPTHCDVMVVRFNPRRFWQMLSISISSACVANNYAIGLTMEW